MIVAAIVDETRKAFRELYNQEISEDLIQVEKTKREFAGDYTLVVFPLLRFSKKSPQDTAEQVGNLLISKLVAIESFEIVKGFLNLRLKDKYWLDFFLENYKIEGFGINDEGNKQPILVEYSSPNTNKPLHLGHIRNNLLGFSIAEILKANGHKVVKINLVNDRGIHICKSMLAWMKWGEGETPETSGLKGDHLVGKYYVLFDQKHKEEIQQLVHQGFTEDDAYQQASLFTEAKELLKKWEDADEDTLSVWHTMNQWAYDGFDVTYKRMGVDFDKTNYESKIYLEGKAIVLDGLEKDVFFKKGDASIWVDLSSEGLDQKLLLRSDGTSVYITQDIGTAQRRFDEFNPQKMIYIVGNEQIYHFDVLKKILKTLNKEWYTKIHHLSYGMVELPHGRMKSREGKVVDADDLMDEMVNTARQKTEELGKTSGFSEEELNQLYRILGLGAIKYYILKVDPKKNMLFNPEESIDFNGNTGPFIQYTYARIQSIIRKSGQPISHHISSLKLDKLRLTQEERNIIQSLSEFPQVIYQAGESYSPAVIANFCFELVKLFNHYYQETPILKRIDPEIANFRILLSWFVGNVIKRSSNLLGMDVPDTM